MKPDLSKPCIYLAGPITGLTFDGCTEWRDQFTELMGDDYRCLSPMRAKDFLQNQKSLAAQGYSEFTLSTQKAINTRDHFDCTRANLIVMNMLGAKIVSIGTCIEVGWAFQARVPILLIMEKEGNIHDHAMLRECIGWQVETIEEAATIAKAIL